MATASDGRTAALKPAPGMLAVTAANAAVDAVPAGLAVEPAPIR